MGKFILLLPTVGVLLWGWGRVARAESAGRPGGDALIVADQGQTEAVIVVSEETRAISLVFEGDIRRGLSLDDLTTEIERVQVRKSSTGKKKSADKADPEKRTADHPADPHGETVS